MTISKKLAITQLALVLIQIISIVLTIVSIISAKLTITDKGIEGFSRDLYTTGASAILYFLTAISILIIGIIQIVFKAKEKTSGVYLALGIVAICDIIPLLTYPIMIAVLVLSIIGIAIKGKK